ncbi:MAG: pyrroline-5-carboxylate reductase [Pseudomonadota bacterium]|nr:pyrroline-5-carboxylate reductase [Pseudomonadota bacterium]
MDKLKILLIGCGKMGGSLLEGIVKSHDNFNLIDVVDPVINDSYKSNFKKNKTNFYSDIKELKDSITYDSIIIATKPNNYVEILEDLKNHIAVNEEILIISILAGIKIKKIQNIIGSVPIIRAMPNIAASVAEGMTALTGNKKITNDKIDTANMIFQSIGNKIWLEDEGQMDSFTAISGSGPAYFFYFTECLHKIAIDEGFSEDVAKQISEQIMIGSGKLIKDSNIDVVQLRENVTSPNGTTEAALKVLCDDDGLLSKLREAIEKAKKRSIEISNN